MCFEVFDSLHQQNPYHVIIDQRIGDFVDSWNEIVKTVHHIVPMNMGNCDRRDDLLEKCVAIGRLCTNSSEPHG